jgi:dynein heavy chain, axonemal
VRVTCIHIVFFLAPQVAEETARKIEVAAAAYRPCSVRASVLYFVLNDLAAIDPMYQFSLV